MKENWDNDLKVHIRLQDSKRHSQASPTEADKDQLPGMARNLHLVVLQHGLWGAPSDMTFVAQKLRSGTDPSTVIILNSGVNKGRLTYDGIDVLGDRLARLVHSFCSRLAAGGMRRVTHISFISYSLGGLISRYAIGKLASCGFFGSSASISFVPRPPGPPAGSTLMPQVTPVNFVTFASPHLGNWAPPDSLYRKTFNTILPYTLSRTGCQLVLKDDFLDGMPLLSVMAHQGFAFHAGLSLFEKRIALANIKHDATVPYTTAAMEHVCPFTPGSYAPISARYPCIMRPLQPAFRRPRSQPAPLTRPVSAASCTPASAHGFCEHSTEALGAPSSAHSYSQLPRAASATPTGLFRLHLAGVNSFNSRHSSPARSSGQEHAVRCPDSCSHKPPRPHAGTLAVAPMTERPHLQHQAPLRMASAGVLVSPRDGSSGSGGRSGCSSPMPAQPPLMRAQSGGMSVPAPPIVRSVSGALLPAANSSSSTAALSGMQSTPCGRHSSNNMSLHVSPSSSLLQSLKAADEAQQAQQAKHLVVRKRQARLQGEVFIFLLPIFLLLWLCMVAWLGVISAHHYLLLVFCRKDRGWNMRWQPSALRQLRSPSVVAPDPQAVHAEEDGLARGVGAGSEDSCSEHDFSSSTGSQTGDYCVVHDESGKSDGLEAVLVTADGNSTSCGSAASASSAELRLSCAAFELRAAATAAAADAAADVPSVLFPVPRSPMAAATPAEPDGMDDEDVSQHTSPAHWTAWLRQQLWGMCVQLGTATAVTMLATVKSMGTRAASKLWQSKARTSTAVPRQPTQQKAMPSDAINTAAAPAGEAPSCREADLQRQMCDHLNTLVWHKVPIDTQHYHAHAAVVVRSTARFATSHGHVVEFALRQMRGLR